MLEGSYWKLFGEPASLKTLQPSNLLNIFTRNLDWKSYCMKLQSRVYGVYFNVTESDVHFLSMFFLPKSTHYKDVDLFLMSEK